ncbi:unnamed protein product, partial [Onchocerca flexuosa]|uniref:Glutathione peroxidase n=1 Tax=Onchocerca flexuosa TaxID=387005 RepID=A0A183HQ28_9BILA
VKVICGFFAQASHIPKANWYSNEADKQLNQAAQLMSRKVNGENAHPLYKFLKEKQVGIFGNKIKWNFTKFLIDQNGYPLLLQMIIIVNFSFGKITTNSLVSYITSFRNSEISLAYCDVNFVNDQIKRYGPTTSPMVIKHDIESLIDGNKP